MAFSQSTTQQSFTTHALLLGFDNSSLMDDIEKLAVILRDELRWNTIVYWITGENTKQAVAWLRNVIHSLLSHIKHENERLVVYYGGYSTCIEQEKPYEDTCGTTLLNAEPSNAPACYRCMLKVDLAYILDALTTVENEIVVTIRSYLDLKALRHWIPAHASEIAASRFAVVNIEEEPLFCTGITIGDVNALS